VYLLLRTPPAFDDDYPRIAIRPQRQLWQCYPLCGVVWYVFHTHSVLACVAHDLYTHTQIAHELHEYSLGSVQHGKGTLSFE
jgi:hypothetical protein